MAFIYRAIVTTPIPGKIYFHEDGYMEAFGKRIEKIGARKYKLPDFENGKYYISNVLQKHSSLLRGADYFIAQLFGSKADGRYSMVAQLFAYGDMKDWNDNPSSESFVFKNGIWQPKEREVSCGDFDIVRGREEEARRGTSNITAFLIKTPNLSNGLLRM